MKRFGALFFMFICVVFYFRTERSKKVECHAGGAMPPGQSKKPGGATSPPGPRFKATAYGLNKEKRGSFCEDKRKTGGHLVRTIKKKWVF